MKADRYQPLRDAVATSSMPVGPTTFPRILELLGDLLKERDALREALAAIAKGAPLTEPEWIYSDNSGDIADNASAQAHYYYASIARAALADGEKTSE